VREVNVVREESYGGSKCGEENNGRKKVDLSAVLWRSNGQVEYPWSTDEGVDGKERPDDGEELKVGGGKVWFGAKSKGEERRRDKTRFSPEAKNLEVGFGLTFRAFDQW
jgi:hypothetical protein